VQRLPHNQKFHLSVQQNKVLQQALFQASTSIDAVGKSHIQQHILGEAFSHFQAQVLFLTLQVEFQLANLSKNR